MTCEVVENDAPDSLSLRHQDHLHYDLVTNLAQLRWQQRGSPANHDLRDFDDYYF